MINTFENYSTYGTFAGLASLGASYYFNDTVAAKRFGIENIKNLNECFHQLKELTDKINNNTGDKSIEQQIDNLFENEIEKNPAYRFINTGINLRRFGIITLQISIIVFFSTKLISYFRD